MNKIKAILGLFAVILSVAAVFAFRPVPAKLASPNANFWLKYDCANPNQVEHVPGNRTSAQPSICITTVGVTCARQYAETSLELDPNFPGQNIYRVKAGSQPILATVYCP